MKIANQLTIKDWNDLKLRLDVNNAEFWGMAFTFFEQRIVTRYLLPINQILDMNLNTGEGFAVVGLQCSLIETIECFYNGWIHNPSKKPRYSFREKDDHSPAHYGTNYLNNQNIFESFFINRSPFKELPNKIDGASFYESVRCGLLHETQTKSNWLIRTNKDKSVFYEEINGKKILYRTEFQNALIQVIEGYKKEITEGVDSYNITLRENFIAKLDRICKISV